MRVPFSSNTLWTLGIANDEGIDGAPSSAKIQSKLLCCITPPNIPGE